MNKRTANTTPKHTDNVLLRELWSSDLFLAETDTEQRNGQPNHNHFVKIALRTRDDGRPSVQLMFRKRHTGRRGSGKIYGHWTNVRSEQFFITQQGLMIHRIFGEKAKITSEHIFSNEMLIARVNTLVKYLVELLDYGRTQHFLKADDPVRLARNTRIEDISDQIVAHLGQAPEMTERFPFLIGAGNSAHQTGKAKEWVRPKYAHNYRAYLDAPDAAAVAKNLFGIRAYRKPMAACVQRLDPLTLSWFSLFRGLVPPEWIIDAMRAHTGEMPFELAPTKARIIRSILTKTPQPVLRRILAQRAQLAMPPLSDVVLSIANGTMQLVDVKQLPTIIASRGQKNIRTAADLEKLIHTIPREPVVLRALRRRAATSEVLMAEGEIVQLIADYNRDSDIGNWAQVTWDEAKDPALVALMKERMVAQRLAAMNERERLNIERREATRLERIAAEKDRAAWAKEKTELIHESSIMGLAVTVASSPGELARWGAEMGNCIGGYAHSVGLDLLVAFTDPETEKIRINAQITYGEGIVQILGRHNQDAAKDLGIEQAQTLLNELIALGFAVSRDAWGIKNLRLPALAR